MCNILFSISLVLIIPLSISLSHSINVSVPHVTISYSFLLYCFLTAHPDPTLQRNHLRNFGKKLVRRYGWKEEMFTAFGVAEGENSYDEDSDY